MATLVGGIGSSHTRSIEVATDERRFEDPAWKPFFDGYKPAREWLRRVKPDAVIAVYNDHGNHFFFDNYPTFALGVGERHALADEGRDRRPFPDLDGHPDLAWFLAERLIVDEFDLSVCQELKVDHGILAPLPLLFETPWPVPLIPLEVNVVRHPLPTVQRCYKLGKAIRRAIDAYPEALRIVILGTGGLSHELQGTNFGRIEPEWDMDFLERIEKDPESIARQSHAELMAAAGTEGVEVIMWLVMRGALNEKVRRVHRNYYKAMLTGLGLLVIENTD